jgi:hypothetical protein
MEKLSGLVLQLKVKTGFIVSDDLDEVVDDIIDNIVVDNQDKIEKIKETIPAQQRVGLYATKITEFKLISEIEQKLLSFTALREHAEMYFVPAGKSTLGDYDFYKKIDKEIENIRLEYKSKLNTNKIMSTTAFDKLNTISDTIPNIINQMLSLATGISRIVIKKITEWSTEITNEDLSKVIDTSNEMIEDVALINSKAGVQPYITIYKKLKKPIEDIYKSVNEMGKLAGVISYDDNVKNQFKYTNRTGLRPLVPGAAPSARLAPPIPPAPPIIFIKKSIDKIRALFKAANTPEFITSFSKAFDDLQQTLKNEGILTDQLPDTDPLAIFIDELQENSKKLSKKKTGVIATDDYKKRVDAIFDKNYRYIESLFKSKSAAQPTGASGVGETKGAGKFMHSYHAKRFL